MIKFNVRRGGVLFGGYLYPLRYTFQFTLCNKTLKILDFFSERRERACARVSFSPFPRFKVLPNAKQTLAKLPKAQLFLPKGQNFAKPGHTWYIRKSS